MTKKLIDWNNFKYIHGGNSRIVFENLCIEILRIHLGYKGDIKK